MPRDDRHDDADDYRDDFHPRRRKSSGTNPALIIGLVLGGVLLAGLVVCGGLVFLWGAAATAPVPAQAPAQPFAANPNVIQPAKGGMRRVYTREEFRGLVMGKTADEVIAAVGKPDTTQDDGGDPSWYYRNRIIDTITGKTDFSAQVIFENGVVVRVNY